MMKALFIVSVDNTHYMDWNEIRPLYSWVHRWVADIDAHESPRVWQMEYKNKINRKVLHRVWATPNAPASTVYINMDVSRGKKFEVRDLFENLHEQYLAVASRVCPW
jgi:hypothetical protein